MSSAVSRSCLLALRVALNDEHLIEENSTTIVIFL